MNANPAVYRENLCFQDREIHHKSFVTECVTKKNTFISKSDEVSFAEPCSMQIHMYHMYIHICQYTSCSYYCRT